MSIARKLTASLAAVLALSLVFSGCAQKQLTVQEIVANAAVANAKVEAYKVDMNLAMEMEGLGGQLPGPLAGKINMAVDGVGFVNNASKEMKMAVNMDLQTSAQGGKMGVAMDLYGTGGWTYVKIGIPLMGEQWMKTRLTEDSWSAQDQMALQVELLKTATEVTLLGSEKVEGVDSYIVKITPDIDAVVKWLMSQQQFSGVTDVALSKLDLSKFVKSFSLTEWVAKDGFLFTKAEISALFEINAADFGGTAKDSGKVTMDMNGKMKFYDYNQQVSISLPPEALKAQEMPSGK
ncbi:MAG: hypothetical protein HYX79_01720 [Chloroflexi bacterium]|nr:hypothetical protein [Chloroflexota bacterium]